MDLGYTNVSMELDSIVGKFNPGTDFGILLCRCKALLMLLQNLRINFIQKEVNNVAHLLERALL
jgi:hypothetical protein